MLLRTIGGYAAAGLALTAAALALAALLPGGCGNVAGPLTGKQSPASGGRAKVLLAWTAESSQNLYGFNIYRGTLETGPWMLVNEKPILAKEGGTTNIPYDYEFLDTHESLVKGQACWYWLEGLNQDGTKFKAWWPPTKKVAQYGINEAIPQSPKAQAGQ
jgi:hypothetical protein